MIKLLDIVIDGDAVVYRYTCPESFTQYLRERELKVIFPEDCDLERIPRGILTVPFCGNIFLLASILHIDIEVDELDLNFADSLVRLERVYQSLYPNVDFACTLNVHKLSDTTVKKENCSLFFTGGVDATSALVNIVESHPLLINIWGGDIPLADIASHKALDAYFACLAERNGLDYCFIKSNFREMFDEGKLEGLCAEVLPTKDNHGWWASINHILAMCSLIAPLLWSEGIQNHYLGSTYASKEATFDANNNQVVNAIRISNISYNILDDELSRNEKICKVISFCEEYNTSVELKVCWHHHESRNCCKCEKCYRTIMGIVSNKGDPRKYGFDITDETYSDIRKMLLRTKVNLGFWRPIQKSFQNNKAFWKKDRRLKWILKIRLNGYTVKLFTLLRVINRKLGWKL